MCGKGKHKDVLIKEDYLSVGIPSSNEFDILMLPTDCSCNRLDAKIVFLP